jgi:MFS family permease
MKFNNAWWWGGEAHRIFTIVVFMVLASLDNSARAVAPPLYAVMARDLQVAEAALGIVTAITILVVAITSLLWGFWGDRSSRKRLLLFGTLIWSSAMLATSMAQSFEQFFLGQIGMAIGIGCIASVGFSVVTDLIPPGRRGLLMSFWALSQSSGGGLGALAGSLLGAANWRIPFMSISGAGFVFALLYLFTYEPHRGQSEPELAEIFESGERYGRRIKLSDLRQILGIRSNVLLVIQGLTSTIAYGSLVWMPRLYISRLETLGYDLETATVAGSLYAILFQLGLYGGILGGHLGDRWQPRNAAARAWMGLVGSLAGIPFLVLLFFLPLPHVEIPADAGTWGVVWATLLSVPTNGWVLLAFLTAMTGFGLASLETPNRAALLSDLNQPEHRGTVAGLSTLLVGVGLAVGNSLTGLTQGYLSAHFAPPLNYAVGLALFQLFLIPSALLFWWMTKTTPRDIAQAHHTLSRRRTQTLDERITDQQVTAA